MAGAPARIVGSYLWGVAQAIRLPSIAVRRREKGVRRFLVQRGLVLFALIVAVALASSASPSNSKWITTGATGRLIYVPDAEGDRILDFSNVGYKGRGSELLPNDIPTVLTVSPIAGDDTANIQAAINAVSAMPLQANGYRGAVLLTAGDYDIATQLNINASGVVLRGVGRETTGTVLHARGTTQRALIQIIGSGSQSLTGSIYNMIDKVVPAGANSFRLNSTAGLAVGQTVRVERPGTQAWINAIGMNDPPGERPRLGAERIQSPLRPHHHADRRQPRVPRCAAGHVVRRRNSAAARCSATPGRAGFKTSASRTCGPNPISTRPKRAAPTSSTRTTPGHSSPPTSRKTSGFATAWRSILATRPHLANDESKWVTVDNVINEEPVSIVTGSRRYTFDLDGQMGFVTNSQSDKGRHDFVNNGAAATTGPMCSTIRLPPTPATTPGRIAAGRPARCSTTSRCKATRSTPATAATSARRTAGPAPTW